MAGRLRNRGRWLAPVMVLGGVLSAITILVASGAQFDGELFAIGSAVLATVLTGMLIAWWAQRFIEHVDGSKRVEPVRIRPDRASNIIVDERSEQ